jgi:hypothetical protein
MRQARPRRGWIDAAFIVACVVAVFARTTRFTLLGWDDVLLMRVEPLVRHPLALGWKALLLSPPRNFGYPQPLTILTEHLDLLGGARWSHIDNLALHALNALVVRRLVKTFGVSDLSATIAALAFALHPLAAEPVSWATGRKDLLCFFFIATAYVVHRERGDALTSRRALAILGLFFCAIASKPSGVALAPILVVDLALERRRPSRAHVAAIVAMGMTSVAWIAVATQTQTDNRVITSATTLGDRLAYPMQHVAFQLRSFVAPVSLAARYYPALPRPLGSPWGLAGVVVVAAGVASFVALARSRDVALAMALAFALLTFAPNGFVRLVRGPADVYAYGALAGAALATGALLDRCTARVAAVARLAVGATIATWAVIAHLQSLTWETDVTLWTRVVAVSPTQPDAWEELFDRYEVIHDDRGAIATAKAATAAFHGTFPSTALAKRCAFALVLDGEFAKAASWYRQLFTQEPNDPAFALRVLSAAIVTRDEAHAAIVERAHALVSGRLAAIAALEPASRGPALDTLAAEMLDSDSFGDTALAVYARDPALGEIARALPEHRVEVTATFH